MVPAPLNTYPLLKYLEENGVDTNKLGILLLEHYKDVHFAETEDEFQTFTYLETIENFLYLIRPEQDLVKS